LGDSPTSEFYIPTFRNTLSVPLIPAYTAYEDGTDIVFRNVGIHNSDAGESPKRKNITFRTRREFETKDKPSSSSS